MARSRFFVYQSLAFTATPPPPPPPVTDWLFRTHPPPVRPAPFLPPATVWGTMAIVPPVAQAVSTDWLTCFQAPRSLFEGSRRHSLATLATAATQGIVPWLSVSTILGNAVLETSPSFGQGYVFTLSGPGGSPPDFLLIISGQNRAPYYLLEPISMRINRQLGSRATASFFLVAQRGGTLYRPAIGDPVAYLVDGVARFTGTIERRSEKWEAGRMIQEIDCNDWGALLGKKLINRPYPATDFGTLKSVARAIVRDKLSLDNFTFNESSADVADIGDQPFQGVTVTEAFARLCNQTGLELWVDQDRRVTFFDPASGTGPAPFTLRDNDGNVRGSSGQEAAISEDRGPYRNIQYIALSKPSDGLQHDTHIVGNDAAAPTVKLTSKPSARPNYTNPVIGGEDRAIDMRVFVNGVDDGRVTMAGDWAATWQWFYITDDPGGVAELSNCIRRSQSLSPGDEVEVTYPTEEEADPLVRVVDQNQIILRQAVEGGSGIYEAIEQIQGVEDVATAEAIGTALLSRYGHIPKILTFVTDSGWLDPGMLLDVDITEPLAAGNFLVAGVQSVEMSGIFTRHTVTCIVGPRQQDDMSLIQRIIAANRKPRDRNREIATFLLAKKVTDPDTGDRIAFGLVAGTNVTGTPWSVQQTGVIREVRVKFNEPNSQNDIILDVLDDGVSILEPDKLVVPQNYGEVVLRNFALSPQVVDKDSKLTVSVLVGDTTAKDGYLKVEMIS